MNAHRTLAAAFFLLTAAMLHAGLVERWTFDGLPNANNGTTSAGINGGVATIRGAGASLVTGGITLPGGSSATQAYIDLPNGLVSSRTNLTVQVWLTITSQQTWQRVFDFGSGTAGEITGPGGTATGQNYITLTPNRVGTLGDCRADVNLLQVGGPSNILDNTRTITTGTRYLFTYVWQQTGAQAVQRWYLNDTLVAQSAPFTATLAQVQDVNDWLGRSNWTADSNTAGTYHECSIYDHAMSAAEVAASFSTGPFIAVMNTNDSGPGSLRQAIADAAASPGADTILFAASLNNQTITLTSGQLLLGQNVTIDASALNAGVTISGNSNGNSTQTPGESRIFQINSGANVTLRRLKLINGITRFGTDPISIAGGSGGAIYNQGILTMEQCTVSSCIADAGGGISNLDSSLTLTGCTVSGNVATAAEGGGIYSDNSFLTVTRCTVAGNAAFTTGGGIFYRYFQPTGAATLTHCTVSNNGASNGGGIAMRDGSSPPTLAYSIVAGNSGAGNISGSFTETGPNITSGNPLLNSLGSNGGPTQTMALQAASPARDAAVGSTSTSDQRGFPIFGIPDIGAYEFQFVFNLRNVANTNDTGAGSLRAAIIAAQSTPDADNNIIFDPTLSGQTITLQSEIPVTATPFLTVDASALTGGITITGTASPTVKHRILSIASGSHVTLRCLTLTGGNGAGTLDTGRGGAIYNDTATLAIERCTLSGNAVPSLAGDGGALFNNFGNVTFTRCTLAGNTAGFRGGAVFSNGTLALTHCTVSGNATQSTDVSSSGGGGLYNEFGTLTLAASIVGGNTVPPSVDGPDVLCDLGTLNFQIANLVQGLATFGTTVTGDIFLRITSDPLLAPLGLYGGPTKTMALLPGSPARNVAGGSTTTSDQRGFPIVGTPDLGAYEAGTFTNYNAWIYEMLPASTAPNAAQHASTFDFDGDGVSNGSEWLALTDPGDPASVLRITQSARSGNTLSVTFPSIAGRHYTLESTTNLATGQWTFIPGSTTTGTGSPITLPITPVNGFTQYFVRVRVGP